MTARTPNADGASNKDSMTSKEAALYLRMSVSWLAKARMRGDGPQYMKLGTSVRYPSTALSQWMKSRQRFSTSEQ